MIDISREEDKKALVGTITFIALLIILLIVMGLMNGCSEVQAEDLESGGVAVSLGNPDDGGSDNSASRDEAYTPPVEEEEYVPEHQETSDVSDAPEVKKTEPVDKKPTKTDPKETTKDPVKDPVKEPKKVDKRGLFPGSSKGGNDDSGDGKGGDGKGGYKGNPDGTPDGHHDGNGGQGTQGDGPSIGTGISGGIGGFKVAKMSQPQGGVQEAGVIRLKVCVDKNGTVIPSSIKYAPNRDPNTSTNLQLRQRAIAALKKFKFTNISNSTGGCGYINFTFKLQ